MRVRGRWASTKMNCWPRRQDSPDCSRPSGNPRPLPNLIRTVRDFDQTYLEDILGLVQSSGEKPQDEEQRVEACGKNYQMSLKRQFEEKTTRSSAARSKRLKNLLISKDAMLFDMDRVSWLSKETIKEDAKLLVENYAFFRGAEVEPPILLEHTIEAYLGLTLEDENLDEVLGFNDVLGATWLRQKRIAVNGKLLQENSAACFSCGHEINHIMLHSRDFRKLGDGCKTECRTGNRLPGGSHKKRGGWQADYFAACLLMPE